MLSKGVFAGGVANGSEPVPDAAVNTEGVSILVKDVLVDAVVTEPVVGVSSLDEC